MTESIKIRQMTLDDLDNIMEVEQLSFSVPWSRESFEGEVLQNKAAVYLVAQCDDRVIGYVGVWLIIDEGHITNVAVHPAFRNKGIGKKLLKTMIEFSNNLNITKLTLEVRPSNAYALKLYEGFGFKPAGVRPGYYSNGEDAVIMWRGSNGN